MPQVLESPDPQLDVVALGNAIVDVFAHADDAFLTEHGLVKGSMALIDVARVDALYEAMGPGTEVSGGSAGNTAAGVASFGGRAAFIGKVRDDQLGDVYVHDIRAHGVAFDVPPATVGPPTARSLILVTPDAQRTMNTNLGIAGQLEAADVDADLVAAAAICYCEGYLWDVESAREALRAAMAEARGAGRIVAFAMCDGFCVDRHRPDFLRLAAGEADVIFANEHELCSLYEVDDCDVAVDKLRASGCPLAFVTRSEKGSMAVGAEQDPIVVPAHPVEQVVDTTGAGDQYAAGALFGLATGRELIDCLGLASLAAAEVISHLGARPEVPLRDLARGVGLL